MQPTKGFTTSEWWTTLAADVIALLALFGIGVPASASNLTQPAALLLATISTLIYTRSRQQIKVASINSAPPAQTTLIMRPTTTVNPSDATTTATVLSSTQTPNPFAPETNVATSVSASSDATEASV